MPAIVLNNHMDAALNMNYSTDEQFSINLFIALSLMLLIINLLTLILYKILCHLNAETFFLDNIMRS